MVFEQKTGIDAGNAFSFGLGLGMGLIFVKQLFQPTAALSRIRKTVIVCLSCGSKNAEDFKFCGQCGRALYPPKRDSCPKCGMKVPSLKFCENRGSEGDE